MSVASDGLPSGSNAGIVQHGLDQARQSLLSTRCADPSNPTGAGKAELVPLARSDELLLVVAGPAVKAVLEARIEQVVKHGHSRDADLGLPVKYLPHNARSMVLDAIDLLDGPHRNLVVGRRRLAKAAAMLLAAIDRVDVEIAKGEGAQGVRGTAEQGEGS